MTNRPLRTRPAIAATLLVLAVVTAGCGDPGATPDTPAAGPTQVEVPVVPDDAAPLSDQGSWASEGVLHLGSQRFEARDHGSFAVADRTVAYTGEGGRLCFTDLATAACSGFHPDGNLVVSPDGDHLGFLDAPLDEDRHLSGPLSSTVIELSTGRVVASSTQGMGNAEDDLGDLYEDSWPYVDGFDDTGALLVSAATGDPYALPVDGSAVRTIPYDPEANALPGRVLRDLPGSAARIRRDGDALRIRSGAPKDSRNTGRLSPDGEAVVFSVSVALGDLAVAAAPSGTRTPLSGQSGQWQDFGGWSGAHEILASTVDTDRTTYRLYRCDAVAATCVLEQEAPPTRSDNDPVTFATTTASDVYLTGDDGY